jgi:signal transduction histidine kinase
MRRTDVVVLLTASILVMAILPMLAAYYLLDDSLRTSLNLGFNPGIERALQESSDNLRALGKLDPEHAAAYRAQFDQVVGLQQVYSDPDFIKQRIEGSLRWYFGLGLGTAVLLSVTLATLLSRRIARSHAHNLEALTRERDKVRYLEEMSSWQELARMLAHEIKNPLTPIEVLVTSLSKAYLGKTQPEFVAHLEQTQQMIGEELRHLKDTVNKFSEFARLPQVQLAPVDLGEWLRRLTGNLPEFTGRADFDLRVPAEPAPACIDVTLFRQVLVNLLRNGIEANPANRVRFTLALEAQGERLTVTVANDGVTVDPAIAPRIFDPYISNKSGKENMGLGLAIVKKIVLEHGGDVRYEERDSRPVFVIGLPRRA